LSEDGLALQLEHHPQHAVRAGVLGPHVDDHVLILGEPRVLLGLGFGQSQDVLVVEQFGACGVEGVERGRRIQFLGGTGQGTWGV
jgi:hypothetical protein